MNISKDIIEKCAEAGYIAEESFLGGHKTWNEHNEESKEWYRVCVEAAIHVYLSLTAPNSADE